MKIIINHVKIDSRKRQLGNIEQLKESIKQLGLLNPITITKNNVLVAGFHRLQACKELGFTEIECNVINLDSLQAELAEIDENLIRNELTVIERGEQLTRRKQIYEELFPETKKGQAQALATNKKLGNNVKTESVLTTKPQSFVKDTAIKTKQSETKIKEEIQIAKNITPEVKQAIAQTELANHKTELLELSRKKPEEQKKIVEKIESGQAKTVKEAIKQEKKEEFQAKIEQQKQEIKDGKAKLPEGTFEIIVIDPPWHYGREYDPESSRVANPYPEMTQEQLKNIKIPASKDCLMFLWTTHQFIFDAKELLSHWGFDYKCILTWDKEKMGMGSWLRLQCEFCLIGIKGKPIFDGKSTRDILREPRREHSRKPESFFEIVDKVTVGRKLEYFSREARQGWEAFGDELGRF